MSRTHYTLRYLPLFYNDLENHVRYISEVLGNVEAASNLLDEIESAILSRLPAAESFESYHSAKERSYPYYRIYIRNYTIYYVVIPQKEDERVMEVRRVLHNLQDRNKKI